MKIQPTVEGLNASYYGTSEDKSRVHMLCENGTHYSVTAKCWRARKDKRFTLADVMISGKGKTITKRTKKEEPRYERISLPVEFLPVGTGRRV